MRDVQHLEIALEKSILTRCSVLHDVGIIELHFLAIDIDRKIILVDLGAGAFREGDSHGVSLAECHEVPFAESGEDLVDIIFGSIDSRSCKFSAAASDFPL